MSPRRRPSRPRRRTAGPPGESLLARARREPELFADFYAARHEQVLGFFARRTLDPETAFDLMAETFAAAFSSLQSFRGEDEDAERAWLWAIARHQLYRWSERGIVERRCLAQLGIERLPLSPAEFDRVEELAALDAIRDEVRAALDGLGADQREALRLRVIEEGEYAAIAAQLGVSEQVVRARVSRGLRELTRVLEPRRALLEEAIG